MKKKVITMGLILGLAVGSVQSASALFLGCGVSTTYDTSTCGLGWKTPISHTYIFGFEIGSGTPGEAEAC